MGAHYSETAGGRVREAHVRQIELASRMAGSGNVTTAEIQQARDNSVAAMGDLIAEAYSGLQVSHPIAEATAVIG